MFCYQSTCIIVRESKFYRAREVCSCGLLPLKALSLNGPGLQARRDARRCYWIPWRAIDHCRSGKTEENLGGWVGHSLRVLSFTFPHTLPGQEVEPGRYMPQRITLMPRLSQSTSHLFPNGGCHLSLPCSPSGNSSTPPSLFALVGF
jgi:hypothetical protein